MDLKGKLVFITGAASGIGLAMAERCAAEGANLVLADIDKAALDARADQLRGDASGVQTYQLDVSDRAAYQAVADAVLAEHGAPYLLFNNAGVAWKASGVIARPADWEWMVKVNLLGVGYGISMFVPAMTDANRGGFVVNTGSISGLLPTVGTAAVYGATKHAVVAISESLAHELRGYGIHVVVLCPGNVQTGITRSDRNVGAGVNPADLTEATEAERDFQTGFVERGITPKSLIDEAFAAMDEGRTYVITHGEYRQHIHNRHRQIESAIPATDATDVDLLRMVEAGLNLQPLR